MSKYKTIAGAKRVLQHLEIPEDKIKFQDDGMTVKILLPDFYYCVLNQDVIDIGEKANECQELFFMLEHIGVFQQKY